MGCIVLVHVFIFFKKKLKLSEISSSEPVKRDAGCCSWCHMVGKHYSPAHVRLAELVETAAKEAGLCWSMLVLCSARLPRVVLDKSYRDKSWHTPNKFSVALLPPLPYKIWL